MEKRSCKPFSNPLFPNAAAAAAEAAAVAALTPFPDSPFPFPFCSYPSCG